MPRIEKVRITGVKYDKMRKHYENTVFDFFNETEPQHGLLTLVNGGGKGMLLQMIFQPLIPLTTWGNNGENHIDALFYNEKQQFEPYTFHVALEWRLDTDPAEWLVTGICVTARKNNQENDENVTEPYYFLYTSKYRKPEDWQIETLPLYDEENKFVTSYDDWETWLKKHRQQFTIYSKSKQQAYFQFLSSYGIEKGEWRQMREINRDEGGIEHYFKKGLDNFGLFHNLIIPEISAYLKEDQEENLLKIFRDNSIIAQKLPKLLKREEAYQLIGGKLVPIKTSLEEGQSLEIEADEHYDRANFLYFGMEEQKQTYQFEQEKWEEDKQKTENLKAEFLWQKDNLEYAEVCRSLDEASHEMETREFQVKELERLKQGLDSEKHDLEVSIGFKEYIESTEELKRIDAQIHRLEERQNLQEEKQQIEIIEQDLSEHWKVIKNELQVDIERFNRLESRFNKELKALANEISINQTDLNKVRSKLDTFTTFIKAHNQKAIMMEQKYGRDINRDPEFVERKTVKELEDLEIVLTNLYKEQEDKLLSKGQMGEQLGEFKEKIKNKRMELVEIGRKKQHRLDDEQRFHRSWSRYQLVDQEYQPFTADDWIDILNQLNKDLERIKQQYQNIQKDFWSHQLDTALVNDEYWIANYDVRKMAEKLAEEGIPASFGTQLIQELPYEEQALLLERYPLLAYGIVVHQQDWDKKVDHTELQKLLAHSPVPIFIREQMNQEYTLPFEVVRDQGVAMAFDREKWTLWKEKLADLTEGFTADLEKLEAKLTEVEQLLVTAKNLSICSYQEILLEEETAKGQLETVEQQQKQFQEDMNAIETRIKELGKAIQQSLQEQKSLEKKLDEIRRWVSEHKQFQEYQILKTEAQTKESDLSQRLRMLDIQRVEQSENLAQWERSFQVWKIGMEQETKNLKEVLPEIQFPLSQTLYTVEDEVPQLKNTIFADASPKVKQWHFHQQKINNVDSELAREKTKREFQLKDQQQKKDYLDQLEQNWLEWELSVLPIEILFEQLKQKRGQLDKFDDELGIIKGKIQNLEGKLEQIKINQQKLEQQILKKHHRNAEAWADLNLEVKVEEIDGALKRIYQDLEEQNSIISGLIKQREQLEKQVEILKSHRQSFRNVGEIPVSYRELLKTEPEKLIQQWIRQNTELMKQKEQFHKGFKERLKELSYVLQDDKIDVALRQNMNNLLPQLESDSIRSGLSVISSVLEYIQLELQKLKDDKQKAEEAQEIWVDRAVFRVIRIFQSLKDMVKRMKIQNKEGYNFPLVEIERLKEIETADEEEYRRLLREHFTQTIEKLLESEESIESLTDSQLKKYIDDSQLVLVALRNRYPKLVIYKPQTTNAFLYEKPRKHHYTDWETLNKGSKVEAKGSGGQLLAARTIIMMMIMTFKRQEHRNDWSVLINDNPFGQAVSAHILDPIFSIAEVLRFQWIVLAPPELIKLDVSRRFPVYWKLELSQKKHGEMVKEVLQHGGRTFEDFELSLF
jgi:hypothetical protein